MMQTTQSHPTDRMRLSSSVDIHGEDKGVSGFCLFPVADQLLVGKLLSARVPGRINNNQSEVEEMMEGTVLMKEEKKKHTS